MSMGGAVIKMREEARSLAKQRRMELVMVVGAFLRPRLASRLTSRRNRCVRQRQRDRETETETDRQTDRDRDRDRQTDRQTDKESRLVVALFAVDVLHLPNCA